MKRLQIGWINKRKLVLSAFAALALLLLVGTAAADVFPSLASWALGFLFSGIAEGLKVLSYAIWGMTHAQMDLLTTEFWNRPEVNKDPFLALSGFIMELIMPVMAFAIIFTAIKLILAAESPGERSAAKSQLQNLMVGLILIPLSPMLYQLLINVNHSMTLELLDGPSSTFQQVTGQTDLSGALKQTFTSNKIFFIFIYCCAYIVALLAVLIIVLRHVMVVLFGVLMPLTVFLYLFDFTKSLGRKFLKWSITWAFTPTVMSVWIIIAGTLLVGGGDQTNQTFLGVVFLLMIALSPLQLTGALESLGAVMTSAGQFVGGAAGTGMVAAGQIMQSQSAEGLMMAGMKVGGEQVFKALSSGGGGAAPDVGGAMGATGGGGGGGGAGATAGAAAGKAGGAAVRAGGKATAAGVEAGSSAAGKGLMKGGTALSATGLGAIVGVPMIAAGAGVQVGGKVAAKVIEKGADVAGKMVEQVGKQMGKAADTAVKSAAKSAKSAVTQGAKGASGAGRGLTGKLSSFAKSPAAKKMGKAALSGGKQMGGSIMKNAAALAKGPQNVEDGQEAPSGKSNLSKLAASAGRARAAKKDAMSAKGKSAPQKAESNTPSADTSDSGKGAAAGKAIGDAIRSGSTQAGKAAGDAIRSGSSAAGDAVKSTGSSLFRSGAQSMAAGPLGVALGVGQMAAGASLVAAGVGLKYGGKAAAVATEKGAKVGGSVAAKAAEKTGEKVDKFAPGQAPTNAQGASGASGQTSGGASTKEKSATGEFVGGVKGHFAQQRKSYENKGDSRTTANAKVAGKTAANLAGLTGMGMAGAVLVGVASIGGGFVPVALGIGIGAVLAKKVSDKTGIGRGLAAAAKANPRTRGIVKGFQSRGIANTVRGYRSMSTSGERASFVAGKTVSAGLSLGVGAVKLGAWAAKRGTEALATGGLSVVARGAGLGWKAAGISRDKSGSMFSTKGWSWNAKTNVQAAGQKMGEVRDAWRGTSTPKGGTDASTSAATGQGATGSSGRSGSGAPGQDRPMTSREAADSARERTNAGYTKFQNLDGKTQSDMITAQYAKGKANDSNYTMSQAGKDARAEHNKQGGWGGMSQADRDTATTQELNGSKAAYNMSPLLGRDMAEHIGRTTGATSAADVAKLKDSDLAKAGLSEADRTSVHNSAVDAVRFEVHWAAVDAANEGSGDYGLLSFAEQREKHEEKAEEMGVKDRGYDDVTRDTGLSLQEGEKLEAAGFDSAKDVADAEPGALKDALTGGYTMEKAYDDVRNDSGLGGRKEFDSLSPNDQRSLAESQFLAKTGYDSDGLNSTVNDAQTNASAAESKKSAPSDDQLTGGKSAGSRLEEHDKWQSTMDSIIGASYHKRRQQYSSWDDIEAMFTDGDKGSDQGKKNVG